MGNPVIFFGNSVKALKNSFVLGTQATIFSGTTDPTSVATAGTIGDLYIRTGTPNIYQKITTSGTDTNWSTLPTVTTGDISPTSFSAANNTSNQTVTGFAFANASIRGFTATVTATIIATSSLYETFTIQGIQRGADWVISTTATGDSSGVSFTITNAGQIQASTGNYAGFTSATLKFRAITLPV